MERKIIYQFITIALLLIIAVSLISLYNSKNSSIKSSIHNAEILSEILKNGLNTHIVNKDINEINTYINSFSNINNITNLWLVRNESINNQYGINENKKPRDEIDKKVLETGELTYKLNEDLFHTNLRITIPYKAISNNSVDCLSCHNGSQGDTLGAISMELNISELKDIGFETIYLTPIVIIIGILIILFIFRKTLNQYQLIFDNLSKSLNSAANGKFKKTSYPDKLSKDMTILLDKFNNLGLIKKNSG